METAPSSPTNKVKFLCSNGGRILPRPTDGNLKYVGGETRVVAVPRDVTFAELTKKLSTMFEAGMVLKYQLASEDLDALVSVRSDEDLKHMFEEYDRHELTGSPMLRAFLFPSTPTIVESHTPVDPHAMEQRYIDAINGVIRTNLMNVKISAINTARPAFSISSACSSPKSPDGHPPDALSQETISIHGYHGNLIPIPKVHSSPALYGPNNVAYTGTSPGNHIYAPQPHYYVNQHQLTGYYSPKPPQDPHKVPAAEKQASTPSTGRADIGRSPLNQGFSHHQPSSRYPRGSGSGNIYYYDEGVYGYRRVDRDDSSLPQSPR